MLDHDRFGGKTQFKLENNIRVQGERGLGIETEALTTDVRRVDDPAFGR
jgi:hypothetical protein